MNKTVVGLYDDYSDAQRAVDDLTGAGFPRDDISMVANNADSRFAEGATAGTTGSRAGSGAAEGATIGGLAGLAVGLVLALIPGVGPIAAIGPIAAGLSGAGIGVVGGGIIGALTGAGIPKEHADIYAEAVRRGGTLVIVNTPEERAEEAADILDRYNPVDIDRRAASYRESGYTGFREEAPAYTPSQLAAERARAANYATAATAATAATTGRTDAGRRVEAGREVTIPVVEETLRVGKRPVERGGARIHTHVTERPVEEQVTLHEEHVHVERHPVDRPASTADMDAFKEGTIEVRERAEEAVVAKQARVVEEVVINKEATDRTETVRDTVRRTDVDVDELRATGKADRFDGFDEEFRNDFTTRYGSMAGATWDAYRPAYRYGYDMAADPRYAQMTDWSQAEPQLRRDWEARSAGTWDRFKDSVRYAWDRTKAAGRRAENAVTGRA